MELKSLKGRMMDLVMMSVTLVAHLTPYNFFIFCKQSILSIQLVVAYTLVTASILWLVGPKASRSPSCSNGYALEIGQSGCRHEAERGTVIRLLRPERFDCRESLYA